MIEAKQDNVEYLQAEAALRKLLTSQSIFLQPVAYGKKGVDSE
jgi:hypothetical protein